MGDICIACSMTPAQFMELTLPQLHAIESALVRKIKSEAG